MASLVLAWLAQALYIGVLFAITGLHGGASIGALGVALIAGLVETLRLGVYLAMALIIISAVFSWVNPHAAIAPAVHRLAEPLLRPFRRVIPLGRRVDLSPLFALLALQALLIVLGSARASLLPFLIR
ncbi:MAG: YggT family protein [Rhodocyclaceae bacterium]|nr:YggT family protein [Rhodocyclaceae bacterium]